MRIKIDLVGNRYGRLLVLSDTGRRYKNGDIYWLCKCDCGNEVEINGNNIKSGRTISCGCYNKEIITNRNFKHGHNTRNKTSSEYIAWCNMVARCENHNDARYDTYGARGIIVCEEWRKDFSSFLKHIGLKPSKKYSIDRINNNGNYEPGNVRWGTDEQQFRNKTDNHWIEHNGKRMILTDWAKELKTTHAAILKMLKKKSFSNVYEYYTSNKRRKTRL